MKGFDPSQYLILVVAPQLRLRILKSTEFVISHQQNPS